jgi:hypothetical protein
VRHAPTIAEVDGLLLKLFMIDETSRTAGGQYVFANREAAEAYVQARSCKDSAAIRTFAT